MITAGTDRKSYFIIAAPRSHIIIERVKYDREWLWNIQHKDRPYSGKFVVHYSVEEIIEFTGQKNLMSLFHPRELL